ncbi:serine--tRNA ligase [bacterium]|nr:serine--tRNA ligase [bacterium]
MLDIKFIQENPDLIKEAARKKRLSFDVDELIAIDLRRRELLSMVESMRERQNKTSEKIAGVAGPELRTSLIAEMQSLKRDLQKKEEELRGVMVHWQKLLLSVPNIPDMSVPEGENDEDNKEVRAWGDIPDFSFTPKSHIELMQDLDLADFERGAKVSGFRGYFLKNDAALLSFAIWNMTLREFVKDGFIPLIVPSLVKKEVFLGTGYLPQGEEDLYKTQDGDFLAGTGEVATMGMFMDEVFAAPELPKKFIAFSPCFRREAGSHGKDTKGIIRVHEFFKLEQLILCEASHETSVSFHEDLTANAERIVQKLGLPYRVVANCGGDLGLGQVKKYDLEAWVPSEKKYRETHSASYFHDFQTRRLNIRYKDKDGKIRFVHSLNNTAIATPRILASILECNQNEDGSINIPAALQHDMGKERIEAKTKYVH